MADVPILIDREDLVALVQALIWERSVNPPGAEGGAARVLAGYLQALGIEVCLHEVEADRPNVIATWRGGPGPTLLLNGHLDVVPPATGWTREPFGGEVLDGSIYGRGAADAKGGLAAIAAALRSLKRQGFSPHGTIVFTAVVDEEVGQIGTRELQTQGLKADFGLVAEPTGLLPMVAHKGRIIAEIRVGGRAAHASLWEQGDNAINRSLPVLGAINRLQDRLQLQKHPMLGSPSVSVTMIHAGSAPNSIPEECVLTVDRRLVPGERVEVAKDELNRLVAHVGAGFPGFEAEVTFPYVAPAMEVDVRMPVVAELRRAVAAQTGRDPGVHGMLATCDAGILSEMGIPSVIFGPGDLELAHKPDEHVKVDELVQAAEIFAALIVRLLGNRDSLDVLQDGPFTRQML